MNNTAQHKQLYCYTIKSTMTDNEFYFLSDDCDLLNSLIPSLHKLFFRAIDTCDSTNLHRFCKSNSITFVDSVYDCPIIVYRDYLDDMGFESELDSGLEQFCYLDKENNLNLVKFICIDRSRF